MNSFNPVGGAELQVVPGTVTLDATWVDIDVPLVLPNFGDLVVQGPGGATLSIDPGVVIEFGAGFLAGRLSPGAEALNGSQAALLLYALGSIIALTSGANVAVLVVGAALALVIGTTGGILAAALARD